MRRKNNGRKFTARRKALNAVALFALFLFSPLTSAPPAPPFAEEISAADAPAEKFVRDEKLQAETDALLYLFDNMPPVPVYLTDEPIQKFGTNTDTGLAYTHCHDHERPEIFVKKDFYEKYTRQWITNILKHELTHAWLCRQRAMSGHDERFRRKFKEVGGFGN